VCVIAVLQEGRVIGPRFDGLILVANKHTGVVKFRVALPEEGSDVEELDLAGALFEYFEPGHDVVVHGGDWLCFLKVSLFSGEMVLIGVPR
jgi:hypothetical protein